MIRILILLLLSTNLIAGEGPKNDISDVPAGYKLVKIDAECKDKDPCEEYKKEIAKLKEQLAKVPEREPPENKGTIQRLKSEAAYLKSRIRLLETQDRVVEAPKAKECPEHKTKYVETIRTIEKPVEKFVEKVVDRPAKRGISIGGMVAYSQDGIETSSSAKDEIAVDAYTYESAIGGAYINVPIGTNFEIGGFGMLGGINKTVGVTAGFMFD